MKHLFTAGVALAALVGCANRVPYAYQQPIFPYPMPQQQLIQPAVTQQTTPPVLGGQKDGYGCVASTGETWSVLHQRCVQLFNVANIRMTDPDNSTLAAYAIFSRDKKQAEIFSASLPKGIILSATKGGFISKNGKIRLVDLGKNNWKLAK